MLELMGSLNNQLRKFYKILKFLYTLSRSHDWSIDIIGISVIISSELCVGMAQPPHIV